MTAPFIIACRQCGKRHRLAAESAGSTLACQACGAAFRVPLVSPPPSLRGNDDADEEVFDATIVPPSSVTAAPSVAQTQPPLSASHASARSSMSSSNGSDDSSFAPSKPPIAGAPRAYAGGGREGTRADTIDYEIFGHEAQYVEITLDPGEQTIAEAGAMMFMDADIRMETVFGDPSRQQGGFWSKALGAGKRMLTGESLFMTTFTNHGSRRAKVGFGSPYPGRMIPLHLDELGGEIICQKDAFLCGARGIQIDIAFQKRIGAGLLGGEGFIMQRLRGDGIAIVHAGGTMMFRELAHGEMLRVDTGCLMALGPTVHYDIQLVGGIKNTLFGGEGLVLATVQGPGPVWLQSLPFSRLAGRVAAATPGVGGSSKGEGSLLGGFGDMLMGSGE